MYLTIFWSLGPSLVMFTLSTKTKILFKIRQEQVLATRRCFVSLLVFLPTTRTLERLSLKSLTVLKTAVTPLALEYLAASFRLTLQCLKTFQDFSEVCFLTSFFSLPLHTQERKIKTFILQHLQRFIQNGISYLQNLSATQTQCLTLHFTTFSQHRRIKNGSIMSLQVLWRESIIWTP